ncbi:hypothetical protein [Paenibacillus polymyxa]|uniref:hypothetical protein n=1 Tax=Paenibacillus polymyxa TaxID=1406 RepID=UPI002018F447|nr:hypothetical protein [Paenibacillus polymyxa]UQQ36186.1 hypothetical protein LMH85_04505 [Paenibacillus polymyxa]
MYNSHGFLVENLMKLNIAQPNEFASLLLLKKQEDMIRNFMFMNFLSSNKFNKVLPYPDWKPRSHVKHDCVLLTFNKFKEFTPTSIIELKFAHSPFILDKRFEPISDESRRQDSVWIEGFTSKSRRTGIKADLDRMIITAKDIHQDFGIIPSIHQVLVIAFPKTTIEKFDFPIHVDYSKHNDYLNISYTNSDHYLNEIKAVITAQFSLLSDTYFPNINFKSEFCTLPIGKAFQKNRCRHSVLCGFLQFGKSGDR